MRNGSLPQGKDGKPRNSGAFLRWSSAFLFLGLWGFEFLNYVGLFHFNVEYTWLGRVLSTAVVGGMLLLLNEIAKRKIHQPLHGYLFCAAAGLILIDFFGDAFALYGRWEHYDQVAHFLSGPFLVGSFFLFYRQLAEGLDWRHPPVFTYLLAFQTSLAFAGLYEMEEYLEDIFFGSHRSGGGVDTADDLTMNILGGVLTIAVIFSYRVWKRRAIARRLPDDR